MIMTAAQTDPADDNYSDTDVTFTYNPFTVTPSFCTLTVTCEDVTFSNTNGKSYALPDPANPEIACQPIVNNALTRQYSNVLLYQS